MKIPRDLRLMLGLVLIGTLLPSSWLEYRPDATGPGQLWRIFTCHFCHFNLEQLFWNGLATLVGVLLLIRLDPAGLRSATLGAMVAIPCTVGLLAPDLATYRGLSGLASAIYVLAGVRLLETAPHRARQVRLIQLLLAGFLGKCAYEYLTGSTVFVHDTGGAYLPVPVAHLAGGLVGLAVALGRPRSSDRRRRGE